MIQYDFTYILRFGDAPFVIKKDLTREERVQRMHQLSPYKHFSIVRQCSLST